MHPEHVAPSVFAPIDIAVAIGQAPQNTLAAFAKATGRALAWPNDLGWQPDRVVVWRSNDAAPFAMQARPSGVQRIRHRWFRHAIKDEYLASETERVERRSDLAPEQTRQMIREMVNARYTLPE